MKYIGHDLGMQEPKDMKTARKILALVAETIKTYDMISGGDNILVGLSGGPDSVALLHILHSMRHKLRISVGAAYINHMLRPRAAKREAVFCRALCEKYNIPCYIEEVDIPSLSAKEKTGIEETARIHRYRILRELTSRYGYIKIALGHHRDDRAETILFNLARGASRTGMVGMPPKRGNIMRPLYDISRNQVIEYAEEYGLDYMTDASNHNLKFTRNRIRHRIIPVLRKEFGENVAENIIRFSNIIAGEEAFLEEYAADFWSRISSKTPGGKIKLDLAGFSEYDTWLRRRLAVCALREAGCREIEFADIERILELVSERQGSRLMLKGGAFAEVAGSGLYLYAEGDVIEKTVLVLPGKTRLRWPRVWIKTEYTGSVDVNQLRQLPSNVAIIDAASIDGSLYTAGLDRGRRFTPFGRPGSKKVGDFLTDIKFPRPLRSELPVIFDASGVVWLAGIEVDHRVRVTSKTNAAVKIEIGRY